MKKKNLITKMILLFALIVGNTSAWAEDVTVFEENFSQFTSASTTALTSLTSGNYGDWSDVANVYPEVGFIKFSSSSKKGKMTTPKLSDLNGSATLTFKLGKYSTKTGTLKITINNAGTIDGETSLDFSTQNINQNGWSSDYSVPIEDGTSETTITFESTSERFYLDDIKIVAASGTQDPSVATTVTINASGITNTDVYTSTTAGSLSATVSAGGNPISGATVSWSGNNDDVATINASTGAVTLVAAGTVTFTASYAGVEDEYQSSSATYVLAVTDSTPIEGDVLDRAITGVTSGSTSYSNWSYTGESGAVYAGNSAGGNNAIQLRTNNSNSGIVTTTSGGKVKKVTVVWNSNTQAGRTLDIYGKNTAYTAVTNLYNSSTYGTLLGSIEYDSDTEISINGDYEYIGIRSHDGALFLDQIIIKWEDSSKTATTTTINSTGITNTDVYVSTAAGTLSAAVIETVGGAAVSGATVTWSSSNEDVATIDENGVVTLVAAGETTITASYAGDDTYLSSSAEYKLTVTSTAPYVQPTAVSITNWNTLFGTTNNGSLSGDALKTYEGTMDNVIIVYAKGSGSNMYMKDTEIRLYNGTILSFEAPVDYVVTEIEFTGNISKDKVPTVDVGAYDYDTKTWTGAASKVTFTGTATSANIYTATITLTPAVTVTIPASGYGTYCSESALDFSKTDVEAYTAAYDETSGKVKLTKITTGIVPEKTGIVVYGEPSSECAIPITEETNTISGNEMVGVTEDTNVAYEATGGKYNYILQGGVFKKAQAQGATLRANRAYLSTTFDVGTGAPSLDLTFGDETTNIQNIERTINDNQYYTLDGRRVAQPTKGLYIVNGKKVVIK